MIRIRSARSSGRIRLYFYDQRHYLATLRRLAAVWGCAAVVWPEGVL